MSVDRRNFLKFGGLTALVGGVGVATVSACDRPRAASPVNASADYTLRIGTGLVELAPDSIISTTTYNGQFPGPLLRFKEGQRTVVDIHNDTDTPGQLHWHGQTVPAEVDGAAEEGTPYIPAHGMRRIQFVPGPAGFRFYHTYLLAGSDLNRGQYSGQVGPVYIEPKDNPGAYDSEVFLVLKEFEPTFSRAGDMPPDFLAGAPISQLKDMGDKAMTASLARGMPHGYEVGYSAFCINGRMLGSGEPITVKAGERVLFHVLNSSATEIRSLALPGHTFQVTALDGNPVPKPAEVPVLWIGTAERVSAIVKMTNPGVWILGDLSDDDRQHDMGTVVEYAGQTGQPQWVKPDPFQWDYRAFTLPNGPPPEPDHVIDMLFEKQNAANDGFNVWTTNGIPFSMDTRELVFQIERNKRYRLRFRNATDDIHPMHPHRHTFEVTNITGSTTTGLKKDVVMLGGYQMMEIDFISDQPGLSLLHCHMQLHMDYGFMALFRCT